MFWEKLGRGEYDAGQYKRIGKGGREIWIQASYNPIMRPDGKPFKVVKYATDITEQKMQQRRFQGQIAAINKAQAVIEFTLDGKILDANENFLNTLGYYAERDPGPASLACSSMPAYRAAPEYRMFWEKLGRGEYDAGQYKRIGKGGREIWIQASYNPILGPERQAVQGREVRHRHHRAGARRRGPAGGGAQTQDVVGAAKENDLTSAHPARGQDRRNPVSCATASTVCSTPCPSIISRRGRQRRHLEHRGARDRDGQHRPVAAHRRAGREPGGNRGQRWRN